MVQVSLDKGKSVQSEKTASNTQRAVMILREMIIDNRLASGSNHLESELAEMLGMSRTPIREATLILQAQGLVEVKPRHGVRVLSLSPKDMAEIYDILTELESLAAELAARNDHPANAFKAAEQAIQDMDDALEKDDLERWAVSDEAFHTELVILSKNSRIRHILKMYGDQVRRARKLTLRLRPRPIKSNDDHRNVLKAIKAGDAVLARKLHRHHRIQAKEMLVDLLEKFGLHNV